MTNIIRGIKEAGIIRGTRVIIRVDFNVVLDESRIISDFRMRRAIATIEYALQRKARVRILAHLGRPEGKRSEQLSMRRIALHLRRLIGQSVVFVPNPFDEGVFERLNDSVDVLFFENLRFWKEEEENGRRFAKALSHWGDVYIDEAFGNAHRAHASVVAITKFLPSYAGFDFLKEIDNLTRIIKHPKHPFVAILGGAKISTKMPLIKRFLKDADHIIIGGAIANSFLMLLGFKTGKSLVDFDAEHLISKNILHNKKIHLPTDVITTPLIKKDQTVMHTRRVEDVGDNEIIVDVGPESVARFSALIADAKTIVWNGPLGFTEIPAFARGTRIFLRDVAKVNGYKIVGGGDTIAMIQRYRFFDDFDHISTGGGAMLELLSGKRLPAIRAIESRSNE